LSASSSKIGDILPAEDVDLLVVEREHHLDLFGDPLEHRVGLDAGDEGQHIGLHDAELRARTLINGEDVLHRSLRGHDGQVDPVRGDEPLQIQPELIIGPLVAAGDDAHVHGWCRRRR
jgi:hypothetical protein